MANIWFSSDHHFHHHNIIGYQNRPFASVSEMNNKLVDLHNEVVKPGDKWWCLGDVTMWRDKEGKGLDVLNAMHGHKRLILGNHDHYALEHYLRHFEKVMAMNRFDGLWFTHVPVHPDNLGTCKANVHGHIHANPPPKSAIRIDKKSQEVTIVPYLNVSVEAIDYRPIALEDLKVMVRKAQG